MKRKVYAGTTSLIERVFIRNTSTTTAVAGLTGLTYGSSGLTLYYCRAGDTSSTAVALVTASLGTWTSKGFKEVDATNMPGVYEIGIPNAAVASGAQSVAFVLQGAANMEVIPWQYELDAVNYQDGVHFGLTALPNTAVTTNASLLTSGTGTDQVSVSSGKVLLQATQTGVTIPTVTTVTNQLTGSAIATSVWQDTTAGDFTVSGSIGKSLSPATLGTAPGAAGGLFIAGTNAATTITTALTTTFTGNLTGSVSSVTGAVGSVTGSIGGNVTGSVGSISGVTFPSGFSSLTTAAIATAVLTDTGDNTTAGSPGKILSQLGSAFTTTSSSVFTTASLANAPTGGSAPTAAQIATAVWTDTTSGDFTTSGSPGKLLMTGVTVTTNNDKTGYALASNGMDSVTIESGINARQAIAVTMDASLGVLTGATTSTITVKDPTGTYTRAVVTVDGNGNRSADTLTPPA